MKNKSNSQNNVNNVNGDVIINTYQETNPNGRKKKRKVLNSILAFLILLIPIFLGYCNRDNNDIPVQNRTTAEADTIALNELKKTTLINQKSSIIYNTNKKGSTSNIAVNSGSGNQENHFGNKVTINNEPGSTLNINLSEDAGTNIPDNIDYIIMYENTFLFFPKYGTWKVPFIEFPANEMDSVNPTWSINPAISMMGYNYFMRSLGGKSVRFAQIITQGSSASKAAPYYFIFNKFPSILIVGDVTDTSKQYQFYIPDNGKLPILIH